MQTTVLPPSRRSASRFLARHAGSVRPGLTIEDGTLVVTDNYLKVRIPPGTARNERVSVRVTTEGTGVLVGRAPADALMTGSGLERSADDLPGDSPEPTLV